MGEEPKVSVGDGVEMLGMGGRALGCDDRVEVVISEFDSPVMKPGYGRTLSAIENRTTRAMDTDWGQFGMVVYYFPVCPNVPLTFFA